ncbi:MAG: EAL domain-containing protein [Deltaproteobacteria bacterium]|nr:EAL domain-containing protein [Deltaproteobacteria bacterium]
MSEIGELRLRIRDLKKLITEKQIFRSIAQCNSSNEGNFSGNPANCEFPPQQELVEVLSSELEKTRKLLKEEILERKKVEFEVKKLSMAMEQSANLIYIIDTDGRIEYVNSTFEMLTGYTNRELEGKAPWSMITDEAGPKDANLWSRILSGEGWQGILKNKKKDGGFFWSKGGVSPIKDETGRITHYLAVHEDITEKRMSNEKILYLAHYDSITGLNNRTRFIELLNAWIEDEGSCNNTGVLFLLDIDQFKFISDSYGHGMGDEFLRRIGKMLQLTFRYINSRYYQQEINEGMLCRLSGDEFAVFLPSISKVESVEIAEHIRKGIECFYQADVPCHLTASIGVAIYPDHGATTTELLTKADAAMYRAKDLGRNRFHFYSPEEREIEQMHTRLNWKESILMALKEDRFEAWLQPILDLRTGRIMHYEVLARMRAKDGSIILPGPFIDIAERFGLMSSISRVIIEKAMRLQADENAKGNPLSFCINVSGKELGDKELLYFIQSKIHEIGINPSHLIFEITETASIHDLERAMSFIKALKAMGCHISLDDFGIGFTSFLYLKEMDVDFIKIAGSFIKNIEKNLNDQLFVKAITDVAKGMGIKTIGEFVEKEEIIGFLKKFGVDYAQGYFIGKPAPGILS